MKRADSCETKFVSDGEVVMDWQTIEDGHLSGRCLATIQLQTSYSLGEIVLFWMYILI